MKQGTGQIIMRRRLVYAALAGWLVASATMGAASPSVAGQHAKSLAARPVKAVNPSDIRIGLLLASGPHAAEADDIAAGLDLALSETGRAVNGRHLVVIREDGNGATQDAATRAKGLAAASAVDVLVGPATRDELAGLRDVADTAQVPLIVPVPAAGAAAVKCSRYVFHLVPSDDQTAGLLGSWVGALKPAKHVYVLVPQDAGGRAEVATFERQVEAVGGEIVGQESVSGANPDFSPYLAKLRLMGADALYAPFTGAAATSLAADYQSLGLAKGVAFMGGASPAAAQGAIYAADYMPILSTAENHRFRAEFAKRLGRPASEHAARGYDAGRAIIEALRATHGSIEQAGGFAAVLAQVSFNGPRGPVRGAALNQVYIVRAGARTDPPADQLLDVAVPASPAPDDACHGPARS